MNIPVQLHGAWQSLGTIAMEVAMTVVISMALERRIRSAVWRRLLWQVSLLALIALFAAEISGSSGRLAQAAWQLSFHRRPALRGIPPVAEVEAGPAPSASGTRAEKPVEVEPVVLSGELSGRVEGINSAHPVNPPELSVVSPPSSKSTDPEELAVRIGLVWILGGGLLLFRLVLARGVLFLCCLRRNLPVSDEVQARVGKLAREIGLRRDIRVIECRRLQTPAALGVRRLTIALPRQFTTDFNPSQQDAMIAHELAHLAARDPFWQIVAHIAAALWWWHPLGWWAFTRWRAASERAADEASVIVAHGPQALAECLMIFARRLTRIATPGWLGVEGGGFRSDLGRRIARLIDLPERPTVPPRRGPVALFILIAPVTLAAAVICGAGWFGGKTFADTSIEKGETNMNPIQSAWRRSMLALTVATVFNSTEPTRASAPNLPAPVVATGDQKPPARVPMLGDIPLLGKLLAQEKTDDPSTTSPLPVPATVAITGTAEGKQGAEPVPGSMPEEMRKRYGLPEANWLFGMDPAVAARYGLLRAGPTQTSKARQEIQDRLHSIVLDDVRFDQVPLVEVVKSLHEQSTSAAKLGAKAKHGINFILNPKPAGESSRPGNKSGNSASGELGDIQNVLVTLQLTAVRMIDMLEAIKKVATPAVDYTIEDYGIVWSVVGGTPPVLLSTQTFHIQSETLQQSLESVTGQKLAPAKDPESKDRLLALFKTFLTNVGVTVDDRTRVFYNDRAGVLLIRARTDEQDSVRAALEMLSGSEGPKPKQGADAGTPNFGSPRAETIRQSSGEMLIADARLLIEMGKLDEAEKKLKEGHRQRLIDAGFAVFSVMGAVATPGRFPFKDGQPLQILDAIAQAGGFSKVANDRKIELTRDGKTVAFTKDELNAQHGRPAADSAAAATYLRPGDLITVTERVL
jgi:beta-lactamase regulating signal transducer with metallopeptidase domain